MESISYVRNICAHYGRLYNAKLSKTPILYREYTQSGIGNNRIFGVLLCLKQLLKNDTVPNICKELEGKVFEKSINESKIQEFEQKRIILSMRQESEKMMVRYYSEEEDNNARPCTPNLEDVFLVTYREEK